MDVVDQFLAYLQQSVNYILDHIKFAWEWSVTQIGDVPWHDLANLSPGKIAVLIGAAILIAFFLYLLVMVFLVSGQKVLAALGALLSFLAKTAALLLLIGLAAAGGAWIVNTFSF